MGALAGVRRIRIHDLRHTGASLLLASGANVVEVAEALGHAKVSTTVNTYAHAMPGTVKTLTARLAQKLYSEQPAV